MPSIPVDTAFTVIVGPLIDDSTFKDREESIAYNAGGMEIDFLLTKSDGTVVTTAVTLTTGGGDYDWTHLDQGYYEIGFPGSAGASFDNDEEGVLTVVGFVTGVLPFRSVAAYDIVPVQVYNSLVKGTDLLQTDATQISGDATAADNLESQYDTSGLSGDTFPATQAAVGNLTAGTAAINKTAESFTKAGAEPETNTFTATVAEDGTYHIVEDDSTATDCYYEFDIGGNGVPVSVTWLGYAQSQGDSYTIWAYNWSTPAYEQIGSIDASNGTTPQTNTYSLTTSHVGTGANAGLVRFRFLSADGTAFATDRLLCSFALVNESVGYEGGAIWVKTDGGEAGVEPFVNGTADNPVLTWANALVLSAALGIKKFEIVNGSAIQLSANSDAYTIQGHAYSIDLNGQSCSGASFLDADISGICTGATSIHFHECTLGNVTAPPSHFLDCALTGTLTMGSAGSFDLSHCRSGVAGTSTPIIDFGSGLNASSLNMRAYSGGIEIRNMGAGTGSYNMSLEGFGQLVIASTCSPTSTIAIRGHFTITDNVAGGFVAGGGVISDDARYDVDQINEQADLALSDYDGPTHAEMTAEHGSLATASELDVVKKLAEADVYLDQATTPWTLVWVENGTADEVVPTVLLRKKLYDVSGNAIAAVTTRITTQSRDAI